MSHDAVSVWLNTRPQSLQGSCILHTRLAEHNVRWSHAWCTVHSRLTATDTVHYASVPVRCATATVRCASVKVHSASIKVHCAKNTVRYATTTIHCAPLFLFSRHWRLPTLNISFLALGKDVKWAFGASGDSPAKSPVGPLRAIRGSKFGLESKTFLKNSGCFKMSDENARKRAKKNQSDGAYLKGCMAAPAPCSLHGLSWHLQITQ